MRRPVLALVTTVAAGLAAPGALADGRCGPATCRADVGVAGHAEPQPIRLGEESALKVTAKNNGYDGALAIDMQVTVADGLQILSVQTFDGPGCTVDGQFVRCLLGDFRREQEAVVVIHVRGTKLGFHISQGKIYSSDVVDPNGGNNQVSMTVGVLSRPGSSGASSGTGTSTGSSAGGGSSGGGDPVRLSATDPQSILRTGGVRVRVTPAKTGPMVVRGSVRTLRGRVALRSVTRDGTAGRAESVFLGTTPAALARIRSAMRDGRRLRVLVRATNDAQTARLELHVRR